MDRETELVAVKNTFGGKNAPGAGPRFEPELISINRGLLDGETIPGELPFACELITALLEDEEPPSVLVVEDVKTAKNAEGKEERSGKVRKLFVTTGARDRDPKQLRVEILRLEDPKDHKEVSAEGLLFIVEGGGGLKDGDEVKIEEDKKDEDDD